MTTYGVTPEGFLKKPLEVIKAEMEADYQTAYGDVNTDPESVIGQNIGIGSKQVADVWETEEAVYYSAYPNSAEGIALDNVALLLGITRLPATTTKVTGTVGGTEGSFIPKGSLAKQPGSNFNFQSMQDGSINRTGCNYCHVSINSFVVDDVYTVKINSVPYSVVGVTAIQVVNDLVLAIGDRAHLISTGLSFSIASIDSDIKMNISCTSNLTISNITSPIPFEATEIGQISVPVGTLTQTVTAILGWNSITNLKPGITGTNEETDAELRIRRAKSFLIGGLATVEAIRSHLLQDVPGVTNVIINENRTMTQTPLTFSINSDFIAGDEISIVIDGVPDGTVFYDTYSDQALTMIAIKEIIEVQPGILSVTIGSLSRSLTINFKSGYQITQNKLEILRSLVIIPFSKSGGMPPKSFETIVEGGLNEDIAKSIWTSKPAGIETFGNTPNIVIDSMGNEQSIFFTRAEDINIWVNVVATRNTEEPLAGGSIPEATKIIKNNIMIYADTLTIGSDVINQRIMCKVIDVSGIGSATVTLAMRTDTEIPDPSEYVSGNLTIGETQIAVFKKEQMTVTIT